MLSYNTLLIIHVMMCYVVLKSITSNISILYSQIMDKMYNKAFDSNTQYLFRHEYVLYVILLD